jgi:hypothetical protein
VRSADDDPRCDGQREDRDELSEPADPRRSLDGDLTPDELAAVQGHVAACDTCAQFGSALQRAIAAVRAAHDDGTADVDLSDRVLVAIDI